MSEDDGWIEMASYNAALQRIAALEAQLAEYEGIDEYVNAQAKSFGECLEERDTLRTALRQVAEALQEASYQWGKDYLWQKWNLSEPLSLSVVQDVLKAP